MIKQFKLIMATLIIGSLIIALISCEDFVNDVEEPINDIADESLNTPQDAPFLITGVEAAFDIVWDETSNFAGGLSDELEFTRDIQQATFPTFEAIDLAEREGTGSRNPLVPQNNSTETIMNELARLRLYADTLVYRVENRIDFDSATDARRHEALFKGYFYGAVSRYIWGAYWALEPGDGGGGVINVSPYIPAEQMYSDAIDLLDEAIKYGSPTQVMWANTLKARIYLIQEDYAQAQAAAELGLTQGSEPMSAKYNTSLNNYWYYWAGPGRTQFHAADRFGTYVYEDPNEANRIPLYTIQGQNDFTVENDTVIGGVEYTAGETTKRVYMQQLKYDDMSSFLPFLTWQENELMKAEIAIRNDDPDGGLTIVNNVRSTYGLDALTDQDITDMYGGDYLEMIYVERDKELCFTGMRLIDQRRFDKWHIDESKTWQHLPINYEERQANPNID